MSNPKLAEIAQQFQQREVDATPPRLIELMQEELKAYNAGGEVVKDKAKNNARRQEIFEMFGTLVVNHFLEILSISEAPSQFTIGTEYSGAVCRIELWHKIIEIRIASRKEGLAWNFYTKPVPRLVADFDQWSKYLNSNDQASLKKGILADKEVAGIDIALGRNSLLDRFTDIDQNHEHDMATFEEIKQKALEQAAVVQQKSQRVQVWNDRLDQLVKESEQKGQTLLVQAEQQAWQWPSGKKIPLFEIIWQIGGYVEGGKAHFKHHSGWALSPIPDEDGYFDLLPEVSNINKDTRLSQPVIQFEKRARKTKATLVMEITQTEISNLADLPSRLVVNQYLSLQTFYLSKAKCTNSGFVEFVSRVEVLAEFLESETALLEEFSDLPSDHYWQHIPIGVMPIEEIRLALQD